MVARHLLQIQHTDGNRLLTRLKNSLKLPAFAPKDRGRAGAAALGAASHIENAPPRPAGLPVPADRHFMRIMARGAPYKERGASA